MHRHLLILLTALLSLSSFAQVDEYRDTLFVHNAVLTDLSHCEECDTFLVIEDDTVYWSTRTATPTFAADTFYVAYTCDSTLPGWVFSGDTIYVDTCATAAPMKQYWQLVGGILVPSNLSNPVGVGNVHNRIQYDGWSGMNIYGHPSHIEFWAGGTRYLRLNKTGSVYFGPTTDDNLDLGRGSAQFKNAYFDGVVYADGLSLEELSYTTGKPRLVLDESTVKLDSTTLTAQAIKDTFYVKYSCDTLGGWIFSGDTIYIDTCSSDTTATVLWYRGTGNGSLRSALDNKASGNYSIATGYKTYASGNYSYSGGLNFSPSFPTSSGYGTFSHQVSIGGIGNAAGNWSAILGGASNTTGPSSVNSVILGGQANEIDSVDNWSGGTAGNAIIASNGSFIKETNSRCAIIGGSSASIPSGINGTTILGLSSFTASASSTVYTPNLAVSGNATVSDSLSIGTTNKYAPLYIHGNEVNYTDTMLIFGYRDSYAEGDGYIYNTEGIITLGSDQTLTLKTGMYSYPLYFYLGDTLAMEVNFQQTMLDGDLLPLRDGVWDIGRSNQEWVNGHFTGTLGTDILRVDESVNSHLSPTTTATYDFGTSSLLWRDGYFSRNFSIGDCLKMGRETALPSSPASGWIVNHNDTLKFYNGSAWKKIAY